MLPPQRVEPPQRVLPPQRSCVPPQRSMRETEPARTLVLIFILASFHVCACCASPGPASCPPKYLHQPPRGSPSARPTIRRAAEPPPAALHMSLDPFVEIAAGALTRTNVDPDLQMLPPRLRSQAPHPAAGSSSGISLGAKAIFLTPSLMVTLSTVTSIVTPRNFAISSMRNGTSILSSFESTLLSRPT